MEYTVGFSLGCLTGISLILWLEKCIRYEALGGLHDKLDLLVGVRCATCDLRRPGGAIKLAKNEYCECK